MKATIFFMLIASLRASPLPSSPASDKSSVTPSLHETSLQPLSTYVTWSDTTPPALTRRSATWSRGRCSRRERQSESTVVNENRSSRRRTPKGHARERTSSTMFVRKSHQSASCPVSRTGQRHERTGDTTPLSSTPERITKLRSSRSTSFKNCFSRPKTSHPTASISRCQKMVKSTSCSHKSTSSRDISSQSQRLVSRKRTTTGTATSQPVKSGSKPASTPTETIPISTKTSRITLQRGTSASSPSTIPSRGHLSSKRTQSVSRTCSTQTKRTSICRTTRHSTCHCSRKPRVSGHSGATEATQSPPRMSPKQTCRSRRITSSSESKTTKPIVRIVSPSHTRITRKRTPCTICTSKRTSSDTKSLSSTLAASSRSTRSASRLKTTHVSRLWTCPISRKVASPSRSSSKTSPPSTSRSCLKILPTRAPTRAAKAESRNSTVTRPASPERIATTREADKAHSEISGTRRKMTTSPLRTMKQTTLRSSSKPLHPSRTKTCSTRAKTVSTVKTEGGKTQSCSPTAHSPRGITAGTTPPRTRVYRTRTCWLPKATASFTGTTVTKRTTERGATTKEGPSVNSTRASRWIWRSTLPCKIVIQVRTSKSKETGERVSRLQSYRPHSTITIEIIEDEPVATTELQQGPSSRVSSHRALHTRSTRNTHEVKGTKVVDTTVHKSPWTTTYMISTCPTSRTTCHSEATTACSTTQCPTTMKCSTTRCSTTRRTTTKRTTTPCTSTTRRTTTRCPTTRRTTTCATTRSPTTPRTTTTKCTTTRCPTTRRTTTCRTTTCRTTTCRTTTCRTTTTRCPTTRRTTTRRTTTTRCPTTRRTTTRCPTTRRTTTTRCPTTRRPTTTRCPTTKCTTTKCTTPKCTTPKCTTPKCTTTKCTTPQCTTTKCTTPNCTTTRCPTTERVTALRTTGQKLPRSSLQSSSPSVSPTFPIITVSDIETSRRMPLSTLFFSFSSTISDQEEEEEEEFLVDVYPDDTQPPSNYGDYDDQILSEGEFEERGNIDYNPDTDVEAMHEEHNAPEFPMSASPKQDATTVIWRESETIANMFEECEFEPDAEETKSTSKTIVIRGETTLENTLLIPGTSVVTQRDECTTLIPPGEELTVLYDSNSFDQNSIWRTTAVGLNLATTAEYPTVSDIFSPDALIAATMQPTGIEGNCGRHAQGDAYVDISNDTNTRDSVVILSTRMPESAMTVEMEYRATNPQIPPNELITYGTTVHSNPQNHAYGFSTPLFNTENLENITGELTAAPRITFPDTPYLPLSDQLPRYTYASQIISVSPIGVLRSSSTHQCTLESITPKTVPTPGSTLNNLFPDPIRANSIYRYESTTSDTGDYSNKMHQYSSIYASKVSLPYADKRTTLPTSISGVLSPSTYVGGSTDLVPLDRSGNGEGLVNYSTTPQNAIVPFNHSGREQVVHSTAPQNVFAPVNHSGSDQGLVISSTTTQNVFPQVDHSGSSQGLVNSSTTLQNVFVPVDHSGSEQVFNSTAPQNIFAPVNHSGSSQGLVNSSTTIQNVFLPVDHSGSNQRLVNSSTTLQNVFVPVDHSGSDQVVHSTAPQNIFTPINHSGSSPSLINSSSTIQNVFVLVNHSGSEQAVNSTAPQNIFAPVNHSGCSQGLVNSSTTTQNVLVLVDHSGSEQVVNSTAPQNIFPLVNHPGSSQGLVNSSTTTQNVFLPVDHSGSVQVVNSTAPQNIFAPVNHSGSSQGLVNSSTTTQNVFVSCNNETLSKSWYAAYLTPIPKTIMTFPPPIPLIQPKSTVSTLTSQNIIPPPTRVITTTLPNQLRSLASPAWNTMFTALGFRSTYPQSPQTPPLIPTSSTIPPPYANLITAPRPVQNSSPASLPANATSFPVNTTGRNAQYKWFMSSILRRTRGLLPTNVTSQWNVSKNIQH